MRQHAWLSVFVGISYAAMPHLAHANMRASRHVPYAPSSALGAPSSIAGLTVLSESLQIKCDAHCDVVATYNLAASVARTVALEFVLPVATAIEIRHGDASLGPIVAEAAPLSSREHKLDRSVMAARGGKTVPLFRAQFNVRLAEGENVIEIRYVQPWGGREHGHGYFSDGTWSHRFSYELWPLAEWSLADDFVLSAQVTSSLPRAGRWTRWFGEEPAFVCEAGKVGVDAPSKLAPAASTSTADGRRLSFTWGKSFPDRLICQRTGMPQGPSVPKPSLAK